MKSYHTSTVFIIQCGRCDRNLTKCYLTAANAETLSFWLYKIYIAQISCVLNSAVLLLLYTREDVENSTNPPCQKCCITAVARESYDQLSL